MTQFDEHSQHLGYGINFRPYQTQWLHQLHQKMQLHTLAKITYDPKLRGITTQNFSLKALPTQQPFFYDFNIPGQGYSFDVLQVSAIYAGTPVYQLTTTTDNA